MLFAVTSPVTFRLPVIVPSPAPPPEAVNDPLITKSPLTVVVAALIVTSVGDVIVIVPSLFMVISVVPAVFSITTPCGPLMNATFDWAAGVASAACASAHQVPVGDPVNIRVTNTDSGFDGSYQALSVDPLTLTYQLPTNPLEPASQAGTVNFDIDLLAGYNIGSLFYHQDTQQFEF